MSEQYQQDNNLEHNPMSEGLDPSLGSSSQAGMSYEYSMQFPNDVLNNANLQFIPQHQWGRLSNSEKMATILGRLDSPLATYLRKVYGIPALDHDHRQMTPGQVSELVVAPIPLAYEQSKPADEWENGLAKRYKVARYPNIYPPADGTIQNVIQNAANCVQIISNAIKNADDVIDKPNSREVNLVSGNTFTDQEIDSISMHIITALVHRCVVGYCGNAKEDAKRDDMSLNCLERLMQIINTLTQAKSACRDVLFEDCKIALLVHQPITSFRHKTANQRSNDSKRQNIERARSKAAEMDTINALTEAICNPYTIQGNSLLTQPASFHPAISAVSKASAHNVTNEGESDYPPTGYTPGTQLVTDYTQSTSYEC